MQLLVQIALIVLVMTCPSGFGDDGPWLTLAPSRPSKAATRILLVSGDEEYRSEEALPAMAGILSLRHGFACHVLFAIGEDGTIDPNRRDHLPGLELLDSCDLVIVSTRFRELPADAMRRWEAYLRAGKPVVGLRTATHAFSFPANSPFAHFSHDSTQAGFDGGFGRVVLGERWVDHHGVHGSESTLGVLVRDRSDHPILRGIRDRSIWGPTDVYKVRLPLPQSCTVLVEGEVLVGMSISSAPDETGKNRPRMPIAWTNQYRWGNGTPGRSFATTMGAAEDFQSESFRRLVLNACYWALGRDQDIEPSSNVDFVEPFHPSPFGFNGFRKGMRPDDLNPLDGQ